VACFQSIESQLESELFVWRRLLSYVHYSTTTATAAVYFCLGPLGWNAFCCMQYKPSTIGTRGLEEQGGATDQTSTFVLSTKRSLKLAEKRRIKKRKERKKERLPQTGRKKKVADQDCLDGIWRGERSITDRPAASQMQISQGGQILY
jgi:hypothetical protein